MPKKQLEDVLPCVVPGCQARFAPFRRRHDDRIDAYCQDHVPADFVRHLPIVRHIMEATQK